MKKTFLFSLVLLLVFSLAGCSEPLSDRRAVASVNGDNISFGDLKYWMCTSLQYLGYDSTSDKIDWQSKVSDSYNLSGYILYQAMDSAIYYKVIETKAKEMDVKLSDDDNKSIKNLIDEKISDMGGEKAWEDYMKKNCLTKDRFIHMMGISCLYKDIFSEMFGQNGEKFSDDSAVTYGDDNSYFRVLRIYVRWSDDSEKNEKYQLLQGLAANLYSSDDKETLFKQYVAQYDEGSWNTDYPDGCQFIKSDLSSDMDNVTSTLKIGDVSGVETVDGGYAILMRLPLDPDMKAISSDKDYTLRYAAAADSFDAVVNGWIKEANIKYTDLYYDLNPSKIFPIK